MDSGKEEGGKGSKQKHKSNNPIDITSELLPLRGSQYSNQ